MTRRPPWSMDYSTSMLDLCCCALGGLILLMVLLVPISDDSGEAASTGRTFRAQLRWKVYCDSLPATGDSGAAVPVAIARYNLCHELLANDIVAISSNGPEFDDGLNGTKYEGGMDPSETVIASLSLTESLSGPHPQVSHVVDRVMSATANISIPDEHLSDHVSVSLLIRYRSSQSLSTREAENVWNAFAVSLPKVDENSHSNSLLTDSFGNFQHWCELSAQGDGKVLKFTADRSLPAIWSEDMTDGTRRLVFAYHFKLPKPLLTAAMDRFDSQIGPLGKIREFHQQSEIPVSFTQIPKLESAAALVTYVLTTAHFERKETAEGDTFWRVHSLRARPITPDSPAVKKWFPQEKVHNAPTP